MQIVDSELSLRYNVVGSSGSGKSTFGKQLAMVLKVPFLEMDAIFWGPNWHESADDEFFENLKKALNSDTWVLDGNYTKSTPVKWERVSTVIWLDYSFPRTLFQSVKRAIRRSLTKEEIWPGTGNRESFRKSFFSKDSIILWSIQNYWKIRQEYQSTFSDEQYAHINFVRLRSPKAADSFLESLEKQLESKCGKADV